MSQRISERVTELTGARTPFVHATVVRAQPPTSVRPGDGAIVLADGRMEGFVGGQCTQNSVRTAALAALADGAATLLRVLPDGTAEFPSTPGAQVVVNPCLSGGAVEIFLQPMLPAPVIAVTGSTPIAEALRSTVAFLGYATAAEPGPAGSPVTAWASGGPTAAGRDSFTADELAGCAAVVLASHGPGESETLRAALDAGVGYIGLVASRRRGAGVLDDAGLSAAERARVHSPAGLWIGARTAPEIALSIMAEMVASIRGAAARSDDDHRGSAGTATDNHAAPGSKPGNHSGTGTGSDRAESAGAPPGALTPVQAIDPVCGMTVTVMPDTPHLRVDGEDFYFCRPGCRDSFAAQHTG